VWAKRQSVERPVFQRASRVAKDVHSLEKAFFSVRVRVRVRVKCV